MVYVSLEIMLAHMSVYFNNKAIGSDLNLDTQDRKCRLKKNQQNKKLVLWLIWKSHMLARDRNPCSLTQSDLRNDVLSTDIKVNG